MGCGASALRPEDNNDHLHFKIVRPIHGEPLNNDAVFSFHAKPAADHHEEVGMQESRKHGHAKPPASFNASAHSDANAIDDRDDAITGAASPSFREYCVLSRSSSDPQHSHDNNIGTEDPIMMGKRELSSRKGIANPKKEGEKKERKGSKLRDVINRGRAGGKKIGFVRHRSDNRAGRLT